MKKKIVDIVLVLIILAGIGLLLYPTVSDWWNQMHESRMVAGYIEHTENMSAEEKQAEWDAAVAYNEKLAAAGVHYNLTQEELQEYDSLLDVSGTGIMGYIEIPKIDVQLPVYHGTTDAVLEIGAGHLAGSSLPVGGDSTHCVITGHRGLPSSRLFTDLPDLKEGDTFTLTVLDQTLTYQVDQIRTVLPDELENLDIQQGEDYCTLVTCTPYGVNTHRLLVRGHRIANEENGLQISPDAVQIDPIKVTPAIASFLLVIVLIWYYLGRRSKKKRIHSGELPENMMGGEKYPRHRL
jgi:sortase A